MKKLIYIPLIIAVLGIAFTTYAQVQVQSGIWSASANTEGYTLSENEGDRSVIISVDFPVPFESKPEVILGLTTLDATSEKNIRYDVEALSVSRDAMTIKISTWSDTKIFGIAGFWLAHAKESMTESEY
jgi:hypothetical protein